MKILQVYTDFLKDIELLNDEETGALFRAMLLYASEHKEVELKGNERFLYPSVKKIIDIQYDSYQRKCEANRMNGSLGGRPKKEETQKTQMVIKKPNETQNNPKNHLYKRKDKDQEEDNKIKNNISVKEDTDIYAHAREEVHSIILLLKQYWNENVVDCPKVITVSCNDEIALDDILRKPEINGDIEIIKEQMKRIEKSDFATGRKNGWKMTFSKFLKDFDGVLNGKYDTAKVETSKPLKRQSDATGQYDDYEEEVIYVNR